MLTPITLAFSVRHQRSRTSFTTMPDNASSTAAAFPAGSMIGIVGGGQLGMFFTQSAQRLGYRVCCFCQRDDEPAARFADELVLGAFGDQSCIAQLVSKCEAVTYEFESIPPETLAQIDRERPLDPSLKVIQTTQDRALEKQFLSNSKIPTSQFCIVESIEDLRQGVKAIPSATVLKTARDGYDGKGQWKLSADASAEELESVWEQVAGRKCTLERLIDLEKEVSVIVASDRYGNTHAIGPISNEHQNHILDISWIDPISDGASAAAIEMAKRIASQLGLVGTLCVEFFIDRNRDVLVNEIAPRPHNSGHLTIDAFSRSQFDLQALAVSGQQIEQPVEQHPAVMLNLLGDLWQEGEPDFAAAAQSSQCDVRLHLYGKKEARAGRKMGHATLVAESLELALSGAKRYREALNCSADSVNGI